MSLKMSGRAKGELIPAYYFYCPPLPIGVA